MILLQTDRDSSKWNLDPKLVQRRRNLFWEVFSADLSHVCDFLRAEGLVWKFHLLICRALHWEDLPLFTHHMWIVNFHKTMMSF